MAKSQNNRGGRSTSRSKNNNPEGHNQFSNGWMGIARERPAATAAAAAGAVAAGVFLWSKRAQISEQISQLSDQIGEWTENLSAERANSELETVGGGTNLAKSTPTAGDFGNDTGSTGRSTRTTTSGVRRNASRASGPAASAINGGASA